MTMRELIKRTSAYAPPASSPAKHPSQKHTHHPRGGHGSGHASECRPSFGRVRMGLRRGSDSHRRSDGNEAHLPQGL